MKTKNLDAHLKIKSVSESGEFTGYGSVFNVIDSDRDIVVKGAFQKSLAEQKSKSQMPALLWQHDRKEPIGVFKEIYEDDHGLVVKGQLLIDDDPLAKRAYAHMKAGSLTGLSIGFMVKDEEYDPNKEAYLLKEIDLREVSLVTFPANDIARVSEIKSTFEQGNTPNASQIERLLRDAGFSRKQAKGFMSEGYSALRDAEELKAADVLHIFKSELKVN